MIKIIIPISCVSCGKPVGGLYEKYKQKVGNGENPAKVMDELGLERYCCRALFLTHVNVLDKIGKFRV